MEKNRQYWKTKEQIAYLQREYAEKNEVPILRKEEVPLFMNLLKKFNPSSVLEIGTAIGYSTLLLAEAVGEGGTVSSLEIDEKRIEKAKKFIQQSEYGGRIRLYKGDAQSILEKLQERGDLPDEDLFYCGREKKEGKGTPFDLVFLDGPKGQYLRQLQAVLPFLRPGSVILADNVLFRGYVRGGVPCPNRFKTIVKRLREFLSFIEEEANFKTTIEPLGDGMSISIWKGKQNG